MKYKKTLTLFFFIFGISVFLRPTLKCMEETSLANLQFCWCQKPRLYCIMFVSGAPIL